MLGKWRETVNQGLLSEKILPASEHGLYPEVTIRRYSNRIAVLRTDQRRLTWDELQQIKTIVLDNMLAIEVYPPEQKVINARHTRHLWFSPALSTIVNLTCQHPEFEQ